MHLLTLVIAQCPNVLSQTKLLRHPDVHGDRVVCTYGGDLWHAPVSGGTATRLTSTPGVELFAKFSPDGRCIAFTGQANGNEQVCIVPSEGGDVRQLTWYPSTGPLPARRGYGVDPDIEVDTTPPRCCAAKTSNCKKQSTCCLSRSRMTLPPSRPHRRRRSRPADEESRFQTQSALPNQ